MPRTWSAATDGRVRLLLTLPLTLLACSAPPTPAPIDAATVYEEYYVPALFGSWAVRVADAAGIAPDDAVLDVACGTGVVAREAARRVGPGGTVTGLDIDPSMLAVARGIDPAIRWELGDAQALPFPDASFDVVTCQFGLMFFPDRILSIREMLRVVRPGGRIVVAVWSPLDTSPGYATLVRLLARHLGEDSAESLRAPFDLGDADELTQLFARAGAPSAAISTRAGSARFPSIRSWVETEVRGWVGLSQEFDEARLEALVGAAEQELASWVTASGDVQIPIEAHLVAVTKR